jgi:phenylacetate-CoA ligase
VSSLAEEWAELARWRLRPGNAFGRLFARLVATEFMPPEAIVAMQDRRLAEVLALAFGRVPFYRARFAALGLKAAEIRGQGDLPRLPILSKHEVIEHFVEFLLRDLPQSDRPKQIVRSSGTTGRPVKVAMSMRSATRFGILAHRRRRWARVDPMGVVCAIRIPSHFPLRDGNTLPDGQMQRSDRWHYLGVHFETGPAYGFNVWNSMDQQLAWIREIQPNYLETYPPTFEELAFANDGASPAKSISALFSSATGAAPATRRQVERMYAAPLHDAYGLNEIGAVATRCEADNYHVHAEHCIVEVVDADGQPCAPGRMGRVLVTALQNLAMPLIRYDTGDVARAAELPCACGRNLPMMAEIGGRFRRFGYLPEGTRERHYKLLDGLAALPVELLKPLRQYQLHQYRDRSFELRLRTVRGVAAEFSERLQRIWAEIPGAADTPLRIVEVEQIKASPSGKQLEFDSDFYPDPEAEIDPRVYRAALERIGREG